MADLTQDQIWQLFIFVDEYISITEIKNPTQRELQKEMWTERVKKVFPYETNVMTVTLGEIAEQKVRERVA